MSLSSPSNLHLLAGRRIVLIVSGGIAAYKSLDLARALKQHGADLLPVMTQSANHFITPLALSSLAGAPVRQDLFSPESEAHFSHIAFARAADLILTAPASASRLASYAHGLAPDLAGALMLARDVPAMVAPAMNPAMWGNPSIKRALALLREDGVLVAGPEAGEMACGEQGMGRMLAVEKLLGEVGDFFARQADAAPGKGSLAGCRALVTSGPTREAIDPVRYLSNRSSGKQGRAIARALAQAGAETILISGPDGRSEEANMTCYSVESARDMLAACKRALPADIAICTAAVGDWHVAKPHKEKWKKQNSCEVNLVLAPNPDILAFLASHKTRRPRLVIGFAAETENLLTHAKEKLAAKGCDWLLANDVSPKSGILGGEENQVHFLTPKASEAWPRMSKDALAKKLVARIAQTLNPALAG